jgi:hypothetical protein
MGATVILQDLVIPSRQNLRLEYSGMDSLERCLNKDHFRNYPHHVEYVYNSRGFRDAEWPDSLDELKNAIWCVGDSFTVGIGSPEHYTWPQVLSSTTGRRCINISMDGASNTWISRRAQQIIKEVAPTHMVVLWSYFHRRERADAGLPDDRRVIHSEKSSSYHDDLVNFISCYQQLNSAATVTDIFNGTIPQAGLLDSQFILNDWNNLRDASWPEPCPQSRAEFSMLPNHIQQELFASPMLKENFERMFIYNEFVGQHQLIALSNLDYARDYHHFDMATSKFFTQEICKKLFVGNCNS